MFPEAFIERIKKQEYITAGTFLESLGKPSPVSIRINSSKWKRKPVSSEPVAWCSTGFYLDRRPSFTLDPLYHSGCYYPQEASGMFLGEALHQVTWLDERLRVLDLCAAPGGKTTHLASLIGEDSLLVSNETIGSRARVLEENVIRWGHPDTIVTRNDPSAFAGLPGFFDIIVVDAPCSGEGMFNNQAAVNEWSEARAALCSERQKRILGNAWQSLKDNGLLLYCTCTFNPAENEHNIKWLTEEFNAESVRLNTEAYPGITVIHYQGIHGYGFYPDRVRGEGFFLSVVRKKEDAGKNIPALRATGKSDIRSIRNDDILQAARVSTFPADRISRIADELVYIPGTKDEFKLLSEKLNIIRPGVRINRIIEKEYLPHHELAVSSALKEEAFPVSGLDHREALSFLKREPFKVKEDINGWFIPQYKNVSLGFAKHLGKRINNHFPPGMRIRMSIPPDAYDQAIKWDD